VTLDAREYLQLANIAFKDEKRQSLKQRRYKKVTRKSLEARLRKRAASGQEQGEERQTSKNVRNDAKRLSTVELCIKLRLHISNARNRLRIAEADFLVYRNCGLPTVKANALVAEEGFAHSSIRSKSERCARSGNVPADDRNVAIDKVAIASAVKATKEGGGAAQRNHHVATLTGPLEFFLGRHGGE